MRRSTFVTSILSLAVCLGVTVSHAQQPCDDNTWQYRLIPYIWFSGIDGDVTVRGNSASVDASFADLAENLDFGIQVHFDAQKGPWGYYIDPTYIKLSADAAVNGAPADVSLTQWLVDFGGIRRLWVRPPDFQGRTSSLDLIFGGRYWSLDSDVSVTGVGAASEDQDWVDPIIGLRYTTDLSKLWGVSAQFDAGGFGVGSDSTWNTFLLLSYRTSQTGRILFGYRALHVDYETGSGADLFRYDVTYSGPAVGYSFAF